MNVFAGSAEHRPGSGSQMRLVVRHNVGFMVHLRTVEAHRVSEISVGDEVSAQLVIQSAEVDEHSVDEHSVDEHSVEGAEIRSRSLRRTYRYEQSVTVAARSDALHSSLAEHRIGAQPTGVPARSIHASTRSKTPQSEAR